MTEKNGVERSTATEVLRRLLDERGVEYEGETDEDGWAFTRWHGFDDTGWLAASDELCGLLDLRGRYLFTPEQAIAATLGATDARPTQAESSGTCRIEYHYGEWYCTGCGDMVGTCDPDSELCVDGNYVSMWNYCPNCGRRIVEPTTNDVDAEVDA